MVGSEVHPVEADGVKLQNLRVEIPRPNDRVWLFVLPFPDFFTALFTQWRKD